MRRRIRRRWQAYQREFTHCFHDRPAPIVAVILVVVASLVAFAGLGGLGG
jgi:hypothetical protein